MPKRALEVRRARVAMAAGLGDRAAGDEHARADEVTALDRLHQPAVGAAGVAHGREAAHQHALEDVLGLRGDERLRLSARAGRSRASSR